MDCFTLLIDGDCPLCAREAALLERLDRGRHRLRLIDISADGFDAGQFGTTQEAVMGHIHGVLPNGHLVTGVEAFRQAYNAVGMGWLLSWTRLPILGAAADRMYGLFARHRLRLTGRSCDTACRA